MCSMLHGVAPGIDDLAIDEGACKVPQPPLRRLRPVEAEVVPVGAARQQQRLLHGK